MRARGKQVRAKQSGINKRSSPGLGRPADGTAEHIDPNIPSRSTGSKENASNEEASALATRARKRQRNGASVPQLPRSGFKCTYKSAAYTSPCNMDFSTLAEFVLHLAFGHLFPFLRLPPDMRNKIYRYLVRPQDLETHAYDPICLYKEDPIPRIPFTDFKFRNAALNLVLTNKQIYSESIMYLYHDVAFCADGYNIRHIRLVATMPGPVHLTRSRGRGHRAVQRIAEKRKAMALLEKSENWGHNLSRLDFGNRMIKWVQNWELFLNWNQFDDDALYPTHPSPVYSLLLQDREAGRLAEGFKLMTQLSRCTEQNGQRIKCIRISSFEHNNIDVRQLRPHGPFMAMHLMETLSPLMSIRGMEKITWGAKLQECLESFGHADFLPNLSRTIKSKPIFRGDIKAMFNNLQKFLEMLSSCHGIKGYSVLRPKLKIHSLPESIKKNFKLLRTLISEKPCWATYRLLRDRLIHEALPRLENIKAARIDLGDSRQLPELLVLQNAFCLVPITANKFRRGALKNDPDQNSSEWVARRDEEIGAMMLQHEVVKADIVACDMVIDVETPEAKTYVLQRLKGVDDQRSTVDKSLDRLIGDSFNAVTVDASNERQKNTETGVGRVMECEGGH